MAPQHLLEKYSNIPSTQVVEHVNEFRARGFAANPYTCIGHYRFLNLTLLTHPHYQIILAKLKSNPSTIYLDLGCCFGQGLRQLVHAGIPSSQLIGLNIEGLIIDLGYELFCDRETLESKFLVADIFRGESQGEAWMGLVVTRVDVIHCSAFFHLFPLKEQIEAAKTIARVVRKGGVIVGRQSGSVTPGEEPAIKLGSTSFRHDVETLTDIWNRVGEETGTKWTVEGFLDEVGILGIQTAKRTAVEDENSRRLVFATTREEL